MRLTGRAIMQAVTETAIDSQQPGEELDWDRVAERLNARLEADLIGREPGQISGGKHRRPTFEAMIEGVHS